MFPWSLEDPHRQEVGYSFQPCLSTRNRGIRTPAMREAWVECTDLFFRSAAYVLSVLESPVLQIGEVEKMKVELE